MSDTVWACRGACATKPWCCTLYGVEGSQRTPQAATCEQRPAREGHSLTPLARDAGILAVPDCADTAHLHT